MNDPSQQEHVRTNGSSAPALRGIAKTKTGIDGFDDILDGGLPRGRTSLLCGGAGCGKTLFGMQFLVNGAELYGEPGVFVCFEERGQDLAANVASLGFDLNSLEARGLLNIDHMRLDPTEIIENGDYDLEGLFLRLGVAIDSIGAKRVVIDTLEMLFGGLTNYGVIRAELRRLFDWLKDRDVTAIVTAERGEGRLTRHGLEEYVSDCVIMLDHRVIEQISTRRMRVVKYRGSVHGTDEYPFLIGNDGVSVLPISSAGLNHSVSSERVSTGIARLDTMLGGSGYFRGSSVLVSGTAGSGKTSLAAHFLDAACRRGERALFFSFEESPAQLIRNMRSIGIDLQQWVDQGLLRFHASRPSAFGLETHLAVVLREVSRFKPAVIAFDPVSNFLDVSSGAEAHSMLVRLLDHVKGSGVTAIFTSLTGGGEALEQTDTAISSMVDTWLLVKTIEVSGERNRGLYVLKSRGMSHSNQIREFTLSERGIQLLDVYVGSSGVLTGSARLAQEADERRKVGERELELERKRRELERKRALYREQIARLETEYAADTLELERAIASAEKSGESTITDRSLMAQQRQADIA
ncbi:MAG TPA: circadian clock protein KaiC [Polyangiaceae bacterium]|jgi:circadian clock protein KaiC